MSRDKGRDIKDVTTMVTAARSRKIRFSFIIQNFAQLSQVYGQENGDTIRGNCGNIIYLISSEMKALEEISKMCGEVKSKEKDKTASTPLVTVSDLQRLKLWTIIVLRTRCMPFKTVMKPNWAMEKNNSWGKKYEKAGYPVHEANQVKLFDLKAFVNKKREEKLGSGAGNGTTGNAGFGGGMFGGGGGFNNPFVPPQTSMFGSNQNTSPANNNKPKPNNEFDIDEIVKKIDAKIAELEEEEKQEKSKQNSIATIDSKGENDIIDDKISTEPVANTDISKPMIEPLQTLEKPIENPTIVNKPIDTPSLITDEELKFDIPKASFNISKPSYNEKIYSEPVNIQNNISKESEIKTDYTSEYSKYDQELKKSQQNAIYGETTKSDKFVVDDQFFDDFFDDGE